MNRFTDACDRFWNGKGCDWLSAILAFMVFASVVYATAIKRWSMNAVAERDALVIRLASLEPLPGVIAKMAENDQRRIDALAQADDELNECLRNLGKRSKKR